MTEWKLVPVTTLQNALQALEESIGYVEHDCATNWRQGMPTRKAQLDAMLAELGNHRHSIELLRTILAAPTPPVVLPPHDDPTSDPWLHEYAERYARAALAQYGIKEQSDE
jgi:hypothetical protein